MSKYFDMIVFLIFVAMFSWACTMHAEAKKAEYEYYVFAKHLTIHQLKENDCMYVEEEKADE